MCRAFSVTLRKAGLRWFNNLPPHSISSFRQLAGAFTTHFATGRVPKKTSAALLRFQQGKNESLKDYLAHFNRLALDIKDLHEGVAIHQIITGLRSGPFSLSLAKKLVSSLEKLLERAEKYVNAKEFEQSRYVQDDWQEQRHFMILGEKNVVADNTT